MWIWVDSLWCFSYNDALRFSVLHYPCCPLIFFFLLLIRNIEPYNKDQHVVYFIIKIGASVLQKEVCWVLNYNSLNIYRKNHFPSCTWKYVGLIISQFDPLSFWNVFQWHFQVTNYSWRCMTTFLGARQTLRRIFDRHFLPLFKILVTYIMYCTYC